MTWLLFALLTALCASLGDVFKKRGLRDINEYIVAWAVRLFALPFLLPLLFFIEIPSLGDQFWLALIVNGGLNVLTTIFYVKAIKYSDLSVVIPLLTLTPLFILITSPLIVGEFPTILGVAGILLIIGGSYFLQLKDRSKGFLNPLRELMLNKGSRYMLAVAFIWSITSNFDKIGVQNSSPVFWVIAVYIFIAVVITPIAFIKSRGSIVQIKSKAKSLLPIGFFDGLTMLWQMAAINLTLVAYVISVKRTSAIISVVFGYLFFREKNITKRLLAAILMVIGVVLITLS